MNLKKYVKILGIPLLFALIIHFIFDGDFSEFLKIMSLSFIFFVPFGIGLLTVYFSSIKNINTPGYRFTAPWVSVLLFLLITLCFSIEGWACWLMVLPVFFIASSIGGYVGAKLKIKTKKGKTYLSALVMLPFLISPIENYTGAHPSIYKAYTFIDIDAEKDDIWSNVTRVKTIAPKQDNGWLTSSLGFPRPIRAELNYNGVGGYRKAIFDKGLIFHEAVTDYTEGRSMSFTITANPHEIPSTAMDEHVVIGGKYFDVMDGTYELDQLNRKKYRLHLYSHFKLSTTFNFYASIWANWIMKDIQNNILQVIKQRAEQQSKS
ncbi:hypothetical protein DJ568_06335 [Mucilaginibacter hurinus]|uniref:SRPBCC family protein n=1 Tax=Mucilaginibacter hurinus TaxID=2201324 RepID=A0A367GR76_9SPHI|nr:hypothetical protein DJ568_06335 [Mucilaginibacter hurinus]